MTTTHNCMHELVQIMTTTHNWIHELVHVMNCRAPVGRDGRIDGVKHCRSREKSETRQPHKWVVAIGEEREWLDDLKRIRRGHG